MTVLDHLNVTFGGSGSLLRKESTVEVRLWHDPDCAGMAIVCTVGMSEMKQNLQPTEGCPSKEPRTELMLYTHLADSDRLAQLLLDLSFYPFRTGRVIFWWHTLPLGKALFAGSNITSVLFTFPPIAADKSTFYISGTRRDLVWAIPICQSELDMCRTNGIEAFETALENSNVDVADLNRNPVV